MAATILRRPECDVAVKSDVPADAVRLEVPLQAPPRRRAGARRGWRAHSDA